jgi:hypothetical protein
MLTSFSPLVRDQTVKDRERMNGFYGVLFCTILADGAEVLGSSSESPAGQRWPTLPKDARSPVTSLYSKGLILTYLLTPAP